MILSRWINAIGPLASDLAKVEVVGSNPIARSIHPQNPSAIRAGVPAFSGSAVRLLTVLPRAAKAPCYHH